ARCKAALTLSNKTRCPKCRLEYCLTHRHAEDHECRGLARHGNSNKLVQSITTVFSKPSAPQPSVSNSKRKPAATDVKQQLKDTAHRRQRPTDDLPTKYRCGHCPLVFTTVAELRGHVQQQ